MHISYKQKAFTLVELMVAIAVVAITLSYGFPKLNRLMANNNSIVLGENIAGALQFARTEAIKRAKMVTLCPANDDGSDCASDSWAGRGWLVVVDTAASETATAPVVASTAAILRRWDKLSDKASLSFDNDRKFIRFTSIGMLARVAGTNPVVITSRTSECAGAFARTININLTGMIGVVKTDC